MELNEWHFRLGGDETDIVSMLELFAEEASTKDEHGHTHLIMDLPQTREESRLAREAADGLLAQLNAIARIVHGNHRNVTVTGVGLKHPDGTLELFLHLSAGIRARAHFGASLVGSDRVAPTRLIGDRIISAADKDEHLERALFLFGSLPLDWRGLYMVLEAAEDGNAGERGLIARTWVADGQIKDFKATANSYKALRGAARHGTTKGGIEAPRLSLTEATEIVRTILERWCKSLV